MMVIMTLMMLIITIILTIIYFDLDAVFDTSRRHLQLIEGVRVAGQVLQVGEQDPTHQHFVLQAS